MSQAITTSIRLPVDLRKKLDQVSRKTEKGKNGIIVEALKDYFEKIQIFSLQSEARKQSLLASRQSNPETLLWEKNIDWEDD